MEYELLAILYATKNSHKLSASQMDAIKEFAIFLDTRGLTLHEPVTSIQPASCSNCTFTEYCADKDKAVCANHHRQVS